MSIYTDNGYSSREEYLNLLREDYGENLVDSLLKTYPPSEDFSGLILALENHEDEEEDEEEEEDFYEDD